MLMFLYLIIALFVYIFGTTLVQTFRDGEWVMLLISAIIFLGPAAAFYYATINLRKKGDPAASFRKRKSDFLEGVEDKDEEKGKDTWY